MPYFLAFLDDQYDNISDDTSSSNDNSSSYVSNRNFAYYIDMIADFIFLIDVAVTSFSAYYDDNEGILITNNKRIFMRYFKGWFFIDLVASMPISLIEDSISTY